MNLAVSLHAADDGTRRKLMPVASGYDMSRLMEVCRGVADKTHRRITFEYVSDRRRQRESPKMPRSWPRS